MDPFSTNLEKLQAVFLKDEETVDAFVQSISVARIARYVRDCKGNLRQAIDLYYLNAKLSQSLYMNIQIWEIALRNKLNSFLCWKYGQDWPYETKRFVRNLQTNDKRRLTETIARQESSRNTKKVSTDAIVADLSAGFWVSLLTSSYDIPFSWRYNLVRIFPHNRTLTRQIASEACAGLLDLRNRIAHHEPVYHLPLEQRREELRQQIAAMCAASLAYVEHACTFEAQWKSRLGLRLK